MKPPRRIQKAYPRTRPDPVKTFLNGITTATMFAAVGGIFFFALTSTLDDMTRRDCDLGVQAACEELKND